MKIISQLHPTVELVVLVAEVHKTLADMARVEGGFNLVAQDLRSNKPAEVGHTH